MQRISPWPLWTISLVMGIGSIAYGFHSSNQVGIQGASGANQYLSEICLDTPVSAFIRVGHGALSFWARRQTSISRRL